MGGYVVGMGEIRNAYKNLLENLTGREL